MGTISWRVGIGGSWESVRQLHEESDTLLGTDPCTTKGFFFQSLTHPSLSKRIRHSAIKSKHESREKKKISFSTGGHKSIDSIICQKCLSSNKSQVLDGAVNEDQ